MFTIDLNDLFDKGMDLHHITNTAYPVTPASFMDYKVKDRQNRAKVELMAIEKLY